MCNAYEQHVKWVEYAKLMQALELNIPTQQTELDLPFASDIRINEMAPVMRAAENDDEVELVPMVARRSRPIASAIPLASN